jgi:hypothetical protein
MGNVVCRRQRVVDGLWRSRQHLNREICDLHRPGLADLERAQRVPGGRIDDRRRTGEDGGRRSGEHGLQAG